MTGRLVVDLSNKSATVLDEAGRVVLIWSGVTRRTVEAIAAAAGWERLPDPVGGWSLTSPPDGFWCPVRRVTEGNPR